VSAPILLMVQVDDATGEVLQDVCEQLHHTGARNVQLLASLGKKGRPAHVLLVDVDAALEDDVALLLGTELGAWGYRVLESRHRHFDIRLGERTLAVRLEHGTETFRIGCKEICRGERLLAIKVEHDHLVAIRDRVVAAGGAVALRTLRAALETALRDAPAAAFDVVVDALGNVRVTARGG
jgi:uncharacterized protein (DUF111 family)